MALYRHRQSGHINKLIQKSEEAKNVVVADNLIEDIKEWQQEVKLIFDNAKREGQNTVALMAIDRACNTLKLRSQLLGQLKETQVNVNIFQQSTETLIFLQHKHPRVLKELIKYLKGKYDNI